MVTTNPTTVVCAFRSVADAQAAIQDLIEAGVSRNDISLVAGQGTADGTNELPYTSDVKKTTDGTTVGENVAAGAGFGALGGLLLGLAALAVPGFGPVLAAGPLAAALGGAAVGAAGGGIIGALKDAGVPDEDAQFYGEAIRDGGAIVTVHTDEGQAERVADILEQHDAVKVGERDRADALATDVERPAAVDTLASTGAAINTVQNTPPVSRRVEATGEQTLPVVQEELQVGKRAVERGGVRVHNRMIEQPVQEQVNLREEHVRVERHPVDRPAAPGDLQARDEVIEVTEMEEVPVVNKQARVVEEVVVGKEATQRTERVRDTVRRTDVEVEQLDGGMATAYDADYRNDFQTRFGSISGASYDTYAPAYQYGSRMASDARYQGRSWADVEDTLKTDYLRNNPNSTWDQIKGAVRYGWERVTGQR